VLWAIARANPGDGPSLALVEGMDPFRLEQYGSEILDVLRTGPAQTTLL